MRGALPCAGADGRDGGSGGGAVPIDRAGNCDRPVRPVRPTDRTDPRSQGTGNYCSFPAANAIEKLNAI